MTTVTGLRKAFGEVVALDGLDLAIAPGRVHGLLGPNGAGKSTLLRVLLGLVHPDAGSVALDGTVGGFVESPGSWPYLTGRQNLQCLADLDDAPAGVADVLERVGLTDRADTRVAGWSLGMRQRLGIAGALLRRPQLLVLDEPGNGLDPLGTRALRDLVRELAAEGLTVLLCSHDLAEVDAVSDDVTVVRSGRTVWTGPVEQLRDRTGRSLLSTSDDARAVGLVAPSLDVQVTPDGLLVSGSTTELDNVVLALARQGIAVRGLRRAELSLEAAFAELVA